MRPMSVFSSKATTDAGTTWPLERMMLRSWLPAITCAFVRMRPSSMKKPEPAPTPVSMNMKPFSFLLLITVTTELWEPSTASATNSLESMGWLGCFEESTKRWGAKGCRTSSQTRVGR